MLEESLTADSVVIGAGQLAKHCNGSLIGSDQLSQMASLTVETDGSHSKLVEEVAVPVKVEWSWNCATSMCELRLWTPKIRSLFLTYSILHRQKRLLRSDLGSET